MIKKFDEFIKEGAESTPVVGSGTAVGGGPTGSFTSSAGQAVYGGDSGSAFATNSNTSGMGAIHSAQPSDVPGDVAGGTKGSGDIAKTKLGPFTKPYFDNRNRKKKSKSKKNRQYNKIGEHIDKFYVTNYSETYSNGNLIQNWKSFTENIKY